MPIYEYRCSSCGHEEEVLQKMSDAPLTDCPACGKSDLNKLISAAGFHLKGSGWYVTDFKGGAKSGGAKSGDAPSGTTETKAKEEPKPEAPASSTTPAAGQ